MEYQGHIIEVLELTAQTIFAALASGFVVGVFLGAFGGGGSVLAAPLLIYLVGVSPPHVAIGTSAAAVAAIALFSIVGHWRGGRVKWPCASVFASAGLIGSIVGSTIAKTIDGDTLLLGFAGAMALIGASMFRKPKTVGNADVRITLPIMFRLAPIGLVVGLAAGFFGIGGGFLIVPGLILASGMPMANATASSLLSVAIFGAATSSNYAISGLVDFRLLLLLLAGGALGGIVGIPIARILEQRKNSARMMFATFIICVSIYVGLQAAANV